MKFQVPQFVEVEDKIFWSLTLKQFIYLGGGGGICIIFYVFLPIFIAILCMLPVVAFSLALAFYRYNNRPFIVVVEAATRYMMTSKLYLWRKVEEKQKPADTSNDAKKGDVPEDAAFVSKISDSKLKDMSWSLDVKGSPKDDANAEPKKAGE